MYEPSPDRADELDARWYFSRISAQLRREISWADFTDGPVHYELTEAGRLATQGFFQLDLLVFIRQALGE